MTTPTTLIVAALPTELKATVRRLGLRRGERGRWRCASGNVRAAVVGMGPGESGRTMRRLLSEVQPGRVIVAGLAGGLAQTLRVGDVVEVREVIDALSGARHDAAVSQGAVAVSTDHIVATPAEKAAMRRQWAAEVVDMETAAVAAACRERGVPWRAVRAISDAADAELPTSVAELIDPGGTGAGRVMRFVVRHPALVPTLVRLGRVSAMCGRRLADAVAAMVHAP